MKFSSTLILIVALAFSGCVHQPLTPEHVEQLAAQQLLQKAEHLTTPADQRAAFYLKAAALSQPRGSRTADVAIYNQAAAELTVLLRSAEQGRLWNHPQTFTCGNTSYRLRFAAGSSLKGIWDPAYFTAFTIASEVPLRSLERRNRQDGVGGALVGIHHSTPLEPFSPIVGINAPVTTVLSFSGNEVTLSLLDPTVNSKATVAGTAHLLDADFTAPLAYYPHQSEYWNGIMGALRGSKYMNTTGLYMLQPYDPNRIPLILVHGLISTPQMWRNVINEIEMDPKLRGRYQCWVFRYPTGNPPAYSALRLREELARVKQLHPKTRNYVIVGHSMGGLITHMQATHFTRESWDVIGKDKAQLFFSGVSNNSLVERATLFEANPHIGRMVFICTPHRGSKMALGSLGDLARRLIALPLEITSTITGTMIESLAVITGDSKHIPNSVTGLAPTNPMLKVLDNRPMSVPHHSIIGDRGKGDTKNSSDGVVEYWSSHLEGAKSEKIVPGPHGACELPETIVELRRILHLHLKQVDRRN